jgi:RNA 3'-terminal phosphate cyclase (ATP)
MIQIDGSFGEGGGQILRTSLALSLVTQTQFRIVNIRRRRAKPGLRRQHLTAVHAAAAVGGATLEGDAVGSTELSFRPARINAGTYDLDIGTAGSTTLVFQTVLPALLLASDVSRVTFRGGTHNHGGPPWDFLETVFLPALARMGATVTIRLERYGFAPAGGGVWQAEIRPSGLTPVVLEERGALQRRSILALVSNLPVSIAEREIVTALDALNWPKSDGRALSVEADGPGNVVMIAAEYEQAAELATGFGQRGVPAERVAGSAARCWLEYEQSGAPVGEHLADQLLLPVALAGEGSFVTMRPTLHTTTNIDTIARFLSVRFRISALDDRRWIVST